MNLKKILALTMTLQLFQTVAQSAEESSSASKSGCDTTKNQDKWYISDRECGVGPTQVSFLANIAREDVKGNQVSFVANVAGREVDVQAAFTFNYARKVHGYQLAWDANLAGVVDGFQLSCVNIADSVKGAQIGFLNVSRRLDGAGVGFFTFTGNGLLHLDAHVDETGMSMLTFTTGKGFFTGYTLGLSIFDDSHPYLFGMGFGYHKRFSRSYLEGELTGNVVMDEHTDMDNLEDDIEDIGDSDWRHNTYWQAKLRLGHDLFKGLGVFAGVSYNALVTHDNERLLSPWTDDFTTSPEEAYCWPGVEIGIRIGR